MIVVTGAAGFIGSAFVRYLNDQGVRDTVLVDALGEDEKWKNLIGKQFHDLVHKEDFIDLILRGQTPPFTIDAIVHLGAISSTTETNAELMIDTNYRYTRVLAEYAVRNNIRFVYASSAATYGDGSQGFSDNPEQLLSFRPLNVYGYSKHMFDLFAQQSGLATKICGLKFFNVFGPNEYHKGEMRSVVHKAFEQISKTGKLQLFKSYRDDFADGEQKRDFVYIKDCVHIMWQLLQEPRVNGVFNLGTGQAQTWNNLAKATFKAMGREERIEYIEMPEHLREKYQYYTQADMQNLSQALPLMPFTSLEKGVEDYIKNFLLNPVPYY